MHIFNFKNRVEFLGVAGTVVQYVHCTKAASRGAEAHGFCSLDIWSHVRSSLAVGPPKRNIFFFVIYAILVYFFSSINFFSPPSNTHRHMLTHRHTRFIISANAFSSSHGGQTSLIV